MLWCNASIVGVKIQSKQEVGLAVRLANFSHSSVLVAVIWVILEQMLELAVVLQVAAEGGYLCLLLFLLLIMYGCCCVQGLCSSCRRGFCV